MRKAPFFLFLVPALLLADDVVLKGAGQFSGRIVDQTAEMVTIDIGDGKIGVPMSRVERIVKGRSALDEYDERAHRLKDQDAGGWKKLGQWALEQGLSTQSRQAYEKVLAVAPDDAQAREALGFVRHEGRWLTEEENYVARGFVKHDGEWMTPAAAQAAQASVAADDARREAEQRANEAEIATRQAQAQAEDAEKRAKEAEERARRSEYQNQYPVNWGGWGYGVNYWPSGSNTVVRYHGKQVTPK